LLVIAGEQLMVHQVVEDADDPLEIFERDDLKEGGRGKGAACRQGS
jgi:hypothetical protein